MSDFVNATPKDAALDPHKRVHYTTGLVLGVDEFQQEQLYFLEKDRLHQRALHGYGTVCGLDVSVREEDDDPEIVVEPGLALSPCGESICVPKRQCARLNEWLDRHKGDDEMAGSPPDLELYVVLCYHECETDEVPIPGGACRTLGESMAASRIKDAFSIELRYEPPPQTEEDAVRYFGELLRSFEITETPGDFVDEEEMEDYVRAIIASPPDTPPSGLRLHPDNADSVLRAGFLVWVTEVRPVLLGGSCCAPPDECCVLLARLTFGIEQVGELLKVQGDVNVDESERPWLLSTRLIQERFFPGGAGGTGGGVQSHGDLQDLTNNDDHPQYWLRGEAAGGDLGGNYPDPIIARLQGNPVKAEGNVPEGHVLTWSMDAWRPRPPATGGDDGVHEAELVRIGLLSWDHDGKSKMRLLVNDRESFGLAIAFTGEVQIRKGSLDVNSFQVFFEAQEPQLNGFVRQLRFTPKTIQAVDVVDVQNDLITSVRTIRSKVAKAAFLPLSRAAMNDLFSRVVVRLNGDFVMDEQERAIDAEFLRAERPTGDRPTGNPRGTQGGLFESWFGIDFG